MGVAKVGSEIPVNTTETSDQYESSIATLTNGDFVVVWTDFSGNFGEEDSGVVGKIFDADGNVLVDEFHVNTTTDIEQFEPSVAALSGGGFVVGWTNQGSTDDIKGQIFGFDGSVLSRTGSEFTLNAVTARDQFGPTLTGLAGGEFVATWVDDNPTASDDSTYSVRGQVFDSTGHASSVVGEFLANTSTAFEQAAQSVAQLTGGGFVITWRDSSAATDYLDRSHDVIRYQVFDAVGHKVGSERIANGEVGHQRSPTVTGLAGGGFVITWTDANGAPDGNASAVRAQVFDANGVKAGSEFFVNTSTAGSQFDPCITALSDGRFLITFTDDNGTSTDVVRGQIFNADGTKSGAEFVVGVGGASDSAPAPLAGGGFAVTWTGRDSDFDGIKAQLFKIASGSPPTANDDTHAVQEYASTSGNVITGTTGGDAADSDPDSGDTLTVTAISGGNVGAALLGAKGTLTIHADGSYSYAANHAQPLAVGATVQDVFTYTLSDGSDGTYTATLTITLTGVGTGTAGADQLLGNAGVNILAGKGGNDRLTGAAGNDKFLFDTALNVHGNLDHVTDFAHLHDKVELSGHIFKNKVGGHAIAINAQSVYAAAGANTAHDASDRIVYNKTTGALYFDGDGKGGVAAIQFAVLDHHPAAVDFHDFLMVA